MIHSHIWSWPVRLRDRVYPPGYNCHQTCSGCGAERFYNFDEMKHGPLIERKPAA
jgi:hypothetical protein